MLYFSLYDIVRIKPLKVRHDVTKLDLTKSLKPNRKPINTPLRVRVSKSYHFPFQSRERILVSTLDIFTILVPSYKEESSGGRS